MRWVSIPDSWGYSRISALNYGSWFAAAPEQPGAPGLSLTHTLLNTPHYPQNVKSAFPLICSRCQHTAHTWLQSFLFRPPGNHYQSCPPKNVPPNHSPRWRTISPSQYNRENFHMPCHPASRLAHLRPASTRCHSLVTPSIRPTQQTSQACW